MTGHSGQFWEPTHDPSDMGKTKTFNLAQLRSVTAELEHMARRWGNIKEDFAEVEVRLFGEHGIPKRVEMLIGKFTMVGTVEDLTEERE